MSVSSVWSIRPISIHALREEGDATRIPLTNAGPTFLSTPSARRATHENHRGHAVQLISIHALREEGDPFFVVKLVLWKIFLSTPSARRATSCTAWRTTRPLNFYPRPPRGGRQAGIS